MIHLQKESHVSLYNLQVDHDPPSLLDRPVPQLGSVYLSSLEAPACYSDIHDPLQEPRDLLVCVSSKGYRNLGWNSKVVPSLS